MADERFWALDGVDFEIQTGEVVGIIGRNGAGKTTLLKILSRITQPTKGRVEIRGKVASLLEVGTGFHPELTGRENIFLNGAILGMTRRDIQNRFDEMIAFAEVEKFLDTPVKRYSSGMYVRLAFAVAAHLDPDVLLVDEVLAVGDTNFQQKCLGRMGEVASAGRTVIFVSHNLGAVENLCTKLAVLKHGKVSYIGAVRDGVRKYIKDSRPTQDNVTSEAFRGTLLGDMIFSKVELSQGGQVSSVVSPAQPFCFTVSGLVYRTLKDFDITLSVFREGVRLFSCHDAPPGTIMKSGYFTSEFGIPAYCPQTRVVFRCRRWQKNWTPGMDMGNRYIAV